jgi:hypothetical protein
MKTPKKIAVGFAAASILVGGGAVTDAQINPYTDKQAYQELSIRADVQQGERVEIAKDKAQMDLVGWNDEYRISIKPQIPTTLLGGAEKDFVSTANRPFLSKRMEYKSGDVTAFIEPKDGTENEFDIDFTLDSKPDTNIFTYKIDGAEEFDFFYQPELTAEEIAEGASRPDNVVGSYAVYHKTKANHRVGSTNYATGKAFHIYRPKATDANGIEVWAELSYTSGVLSVTVPQKFLDDAVYPVRVDPTFGYTTIGGSSGLLAEGVSRGGENSSSPASNGTVDSVSVYLEDNGSGGDYCAKGAVYDTSGNRAAYHDTNETCETGTDPLWITTTADNGSVVNSTSYFPFAKTSFQTTWRWDVLGGTAKSFTNAYATGWPSTTTFTNGSDRNYSIYATYTASSVAASSTRLFINSSVNVTGSVVIP